MVGQVWSEEEERVTPISSESSKGMEGVGLEVVEMEGSSSTATASGYLRSSICCSDRFAHVRTNSSFYADPDNSSSLLLITWQSC